MKETKAADELLTQDQRDNLLIDIASMIAIQGEAMAERASGNISDETNSMLMMHAKAMEAKLFPILLKLNSRY
jgi:hypothetical protein